MLARILNTAFLVFAWIWLTVAIVLVIAHIIGFV
jgi:hypothetical protein